MEAQEPSRMSWLNASWGHHFGWNQPVRAILGDIKVEDPLGKLHLPWLQEDKVLVWQIGYVNICNDSSTNYLKLTDLAPDY